MSDKKDAIAVVTESLLVGKPSETEILDPAAIMTINGPGGLQGQIKAGDFGKMLAKCFVNNVAGPAFKLIGEEYQEKVAATLLKAKSAAAKVEEAERSAAAAAKKAEAKK
jgi:hypothetical protein